METAATATSLTETTLRRIGLFNPNGSVLGSLSPNWVPNIVYTDRAIAGLIDDERVKLDEYFGLLDTVRVKIPWKIAALRVDLFLDPEENTRRIVVAHDLDTDSDQAFVYWDRLEHELEDLNASTNSSEIKNIFDSISTSVFWNE